MPKVSVLMSTYNVEEFIDVSVESVLCQTEADFEFLITNDASTDGTWHRLEALSRRDDRIRLWNRTGNHGNVANQNFLFEQSSGRYIAFMDGDDVSLPNRFERQLELLESASVDICGGWYVNFGLGKPEVSIFPKVHHDIAVNMLFNCPLGHPTVMMKRSVFERVQFRPETTPAADYDYWVRALQAGAVMCNLQGVLIGRRLHGKQISAGRYADQADARRRASLLALSNIGVFPTAEEHQRHLDFFGASRHLHSARSAVPDEPDHGIHTKKWLKKLVSFFENDDFARGFLSRRWYMYCLRSAPLGLKTYRLFRDYDPQRESGPSTERLAIVFLLCLFRVRYHSRLFDLLCFFRKESRDRRKLARTASHDIGLLLR